MPIPYESAVSRLLSLGHELATGQKFDLENMRRLAAALGNPHHRFPSVLVAGTNGKGSTAATLANIVAAAGYRTGLYTSPHLQVVNERIRVFNGQVIGKQITGKQITGKQISDEEISNVEFALTYERVESAAQGLLASGELPWHPSFFEMLTGMMFEYFASVGVELAVLEVGMGGRLDATNIASPCISVITDIDFDHQKYLGNTLPEIAHEKAGIMRRGGKVVLLPQHPQVNDTLGREMMERGAEAISAVENMPPVTPGSILPVTTHGRSRFPLELMGRRVEIDSPLLGRHQLRNLALAITAAAELNHCGFRILPEHVEHGVRQTRWPARFQVLGAEAGLPEVVLDVAHNPAGAWALRSALSTFYEDRRLTFVFGAMRDKAIAEIATILFPLGERVIATQAANPRAASAQEISEFARATQTEIIEEPSVAAAVERACSLAGAQGVVIITGSIYIVGEALGVLSQKKIKAQQNV